MSQKNRKDMNTLCVRNIRRWALFTLRIASFSLEVNKYIICVFISVFLLALSFVDQSDVHAYIYMCHISKLIHIFHAKVPPYLSYTYWT